MPGKDFILFLKKEFKIIDKEESAVFGADPGSQKSELPASNARLGLDSVLSRIEDSRILKGRDWDDKHSQEWKKQFDRHYQEALALGREALQVLEIKEKAKNPRLREEHKIFNVLPRHHLAWHTEVALSALITLLAAIGLAFFQPELALRSVNQVDRIFSAPAEAAAGFARAYLKEDTADSSFRVAGIKRPLSSEDKARFIQENHQAISRQGEVALSEQEVRSRVLGESEERLAKDEVRSESAFWSAIRMLAEKQEEFSRRVGILLKQIAK